MKNVLYWFHFCKKHFLKDRSLSLCLKDLLLYIYVFFHKYLRFTGQQGKGEAIYLTPFYQFHPLNRHLDISWGLQQRAHLCIQLTAKLKLGTFGFRAQVANHSAKLNCLILNSFSKNYFLFLIKILHFLKIQFCAKEKIIFIIYYSQGR